MKPRDKFINTIKGSNSDNPIFNPAIYDFKANFSELPLNLFGQNEKELLSAITKEIKVLNSEVVTCGYDIYNIEAEALGAKVDRDKVGIFPDISRPLISDMSEVDKLPKLKSPAGRMEMFINTTRCLSLEYSDKVYIRGAVSGPYSLAGRLYAKDKLIMDSILNPEAVARLMDYCTEVIITYIQSFINAGQDVVVFDSLATPPLISPDIYKTLIFPFHKRIFAFMGKNNVQIRPLIMGGNTIPIIDDLTRTGANQLLLDYNIPLEEVATILDRYEMAFRINIDPALVAHESQDLIVEKIKLILDGLGHRPNILIGTGILLKDTPLKNIQFIGEFIEKYYGEYDE